MAVGPDKLIRPLTGLVFIPTGRRATLLTSKETTKRAGGGASLDADHPSMWKVVLGYMLSVAGITLTWHFIIIIIMMMMMMMMMIKRYSNKKESLA